MIFRGALDSSLWKKTPNLDSVVILMPTRSYAQAKNIRYTFLLCYLSMNSIGKLNERHCFVVCLQCDSVPREHPADCRAQQFLRPGILSVWNGRHSWTVSSHYWWPGIVTWQGRSTAQLVLLFTRVCFPAVKVFLWEVFELPSRISAVIGHPSDSSPWVL